ncbi:MAG: hypothetical protein HKP48_06760 [Winogradskyella sp.]|uniref:hypothetical protein n=1 Tax=Winogradskyella sp. TaxID=1883156 RepID=UPI00185A0CC8|nr:hypothetical protein [Winogradskyella sp.]MBT8245130.1 hypothetical protein [Winogradskyella sp.]NNK22988.1 hypothetical protein [Winogradskyella sp.]
MNTKLRIRNIQTLSFQLIASGLLSILFFLISFFSYSQVTTEIDTTNIRIGEQVSYKITVETDSTKLVVFPEGQTFLPLEVVEALKVDTTKKTSKFQLLREYKLTQFDSGSYYIPKQKVIIGDNSFFTDSLKVEVNTIEVDTTKQGLYDIKPIIEVEKSASKWWLYVLITLGVIALVAFLVYWFIWRKKPLTEEEEIALLPSYDRAKLAISKLDEQNFLAKNDLKGFYSELTFIIRKFLDDKVYDRSLESTTDELIDRLQLLKDGNQFALKRDTIANIETIFKRADLVKFAKSKPDSALAELDKQTVDKEIDAIKATLPEPSEEEKLLNKQYKEQLERKQKTKKILFTIAISLFLLITTFVVFGATYGFGYVKDKILGHSSIELLEGEWVKSAYGFPPIYIETPKVLKRQDVELPPEMKNKAKITVFGYGSLIDDFNIATSTTLIGRQQEQDTDKQKALNISRVIEGNLKTWEAQGVQNIITQNEEFKTPNDAQGLKTYGTAQFPAVKEGEFYDGEYILLSFTTEQIIQQIIIVWRSDDPYANDIVNRIVESVELNPNVKREEETK